jgi:hypothetical protein
VKSSSTGGQAEWPHSFWAVLNNVTICSRNFKTETERFDLFQIFKKSNQNFLAIFKLKKENQKETEVIYYQIGGFGTFYNCF